MRTTARLALSTVVVLLTILRATAPARADEPSAPGPSPAPAGADAPAAPSGPAAPAAPAAAAPDASPETPAAAPAASPPAPSATLPPSTPPAAGADAPAQGEAGEGAEKRRAEGLRLGLDFGFQRAFDGAQDRLNAGTPTLLPLGLDVSFRTSPSLLFGFHGHAALASRDDCVVDVDSCRARAYGFGAHVETTLSKSATTFVPWLRYGVTYEILYQGGAPLDAEGHVYRGAFDLLDLRIGGDFIVDRAASGKTARIGGYLGFVGGFLTNQSGVSHLNGSGGRPRDLDRSTGSAHLWFTAGLRATLDP